MANSILETHLLRHQKSLLHLPWKPQNGGLVSTRCAKFPPLLLLRPDPVVSRFRAFRSCLRLRVYPPPTLLRRHLYSVLSPMCSMSSSSFSEDNPTEAVARTVRVVIKGRVQGVFYRNWTVDNATELGLNGWVRNRRDGSVEALFSGSSEKVQEMEHRCRRGPPDAIVTGFQVFPSTEYPGIGFDRRPTA